ncbi:MAG TPA: ion channel, partial [Solirubrobacteraceae bacterium]
IAAPTADWTRAVAIAIEGIAVTVTVATSRERESVRRRRALTVGVALLAVVVLIALGVFPIWLIAITAAFVTAAVPVALLRGLLRLMREQGVTLQAVAGSLAIYLSIGLVFAWVIGFVSQVGMPASYFAQHTNGTQGDKVYFSFTTLTTTGFGDLAPATPAGHAIAVIEMLTGQLYLVTVIGLLIGSFASRRRSQ